MTGIVGGTDRTQQWVRDSKVVRGGSLDRVRTEHVVDSLLAATHVQTYRDFVPGTIRESGRSVSG